MQIFFRPAANPLVTEDGDLRQKRSATNVDNLAHQRYSYNKVEDGTSKICPFLCVVPVPFCVVQAACIPLPEPIPAAECLRRSR